MEFGFESRPASRTPIVVVGDPGGGPPKWIREAWFGIEFEAVPTCHTDNSWRQSPDNERVENVPAWEVPATEAIDALFLAGQEEAAQWWVDNGYYENNISLGFSINSCEPLENVKPVFPDLN